MSYNGTLLDEDDDGVIYDVGQGNFIYDRSGAEAFHGKPATGEITTYGDGLEHFKTGHASVPSSSLEHSGAFGASSEILVDGTIEPGQIDGYTVDLVAGETYVFSVYGSGENALPDSYLYVLDETGSTILSQDDDGGAGTYSLITYTADYTGTHVIGVSGFSVSQEGGYTLDLLNAPDADLVPDTFGGAPVISANGVSYGYIDGGPSGPYPGYSEVDTYAIQVEAGKLVSIEVAGGADYNSDYADLPAGELDTVIQLYDSEGNLVAGNDDISFLNGDVSSALSFVAEEDGTYYLDVFAYPNLTSGEFQEGGYSITTSSTDLADLDPLESLIWDSAENVPFDSTNTAYVYFAEAGEDFGEGGASYGWNEFEKAQVMQALEEYSKILGTNYEITDNAEDATFRLITTTSTQFGAYFYPQDPAYGDAQGIGAFNVDSGGWNFDQQQSLLQGGYSFAVILHEFGHAHGLAHPHDTGGGSEVMLGVTAAQGSLGVFDLNQGVYTVMSYNDAWQQHPDGPSPFTADGVDNGWSGTLSAFDIAALQQRYGVQNPYAQGNTVYELQGANEVGTYYETIWDTGGDDTIEFNGDADARIDLMAATIDYSPTGGGVVSFVDGIWGGYTIAQGVVIENATGGSGDDVLIGNEVGNVVTGNAGADSILGRAGDDTLNGGAGDDMIEGGDGYDLIDGGAGFDMLSGDAGDDEIFGGGGDDTINGGAGRDMIDGGGGDDSIDGGGSHDEIFGGGGFDELFGGGGRDTLHGDGGDDILHGQGGRDSLHGDGGYDDLYGNGGHDELFGGNGDDRMDGGNGRDTLDGGNGRDVLAGGDSNDFLTGGRGSDTFVFDAADDRNLVSDFSADLDMVALLDEAVPFVLFDNGNDSFLRYGDTMVTFLDAVLSDSDISYDANAGDGFFA